ncbi:MAG TPA: sulfotransferase [Flavobacteriales bacterium]|jgi:hypothetical protein|nr:sulfotransferase [Flavobacteriales bacterium]HAW21705.1 sulfotransferase [Flavobacteriales bacterium]
MPKATPNFLVIGAARSGTTLLHEMLLEHPRVFLPKNKQPEPHFFLKSKEFEKGTEYYLKNTFSEVLPNHLAVGEISTSYLFGVEVPRRIWEFNPEMKLICILRNPTDRAFSNYWHSRKNGFEELSFKEALIESESRTKLLRQELQEIAPFAYLGRSQYAEQLQRYLNYFPSNQILVLIFEEFILEPKKGLKEIFSFLGVDEEYEVSVSGKNINASRPINESIDPELRIELNTSFESTIKKVEDFIGRPLKVWRK